MKAIILIALLLLLNSCWAVYNVVDSNNKPGNIKNKILLDNCSIEIFVYQHVVGDRADYHVDLHINPKNNNLKLKTSDIVVRLSAWTSGKAYRQREIKFLRLSKAGEPWVPWDPAKQPPVSSSRVLDLKAGDSYSMVYSFWGHHHRELNAVVSVNMNGQTGSKSAVYKRSIEVELLH